jgi:large subunit ribosomal protein L5
MAKLHDLYKDTVVAQLAEQFGYKSVMQVHRRETITL